MPERGLRRSIATVTHSSSFAKLLLKVTAKRNRVPVVCCSIANTFMGRKFHAAVRTAWRRYAGLDWRRLKVARFRTIC